MKRSISALAGLTIAASGIALAPIDSHAQRQFGVQPPGTWVSAYGLMYTNTSDVLDPGTDSRWVFDDNAFGGGLTVQRRFGQSVMLGVDGSYARPKFEQRDLVDSDLIIERGTAAIATLMASGRYGYSGGGDVGFYLTGGIGSIAYKLGELDWNADFALQAGTGLEYRFAPNRALALEWGRTWGYHEKEDLGGGSQTHSALRLALRLGF